MCYLCSLKFINMLTQSSILTISGSDSTGLSGIQADIKTIAALGGQPLSTVTCVTSRDSRVLAAGKIMQIYDLPADVVASQTAAIIEDIRPASVKVGLVRGAETVRAIRQEIVACRHLVLAPGIYATDGTMLVDHETIEALKCYLIPEAELLMLRCKDAELMLGMTIGNDDDMLEAARRFRQMGARWVMLRGGRHFEGHLIALAYGSDQEAPEQCAQKFFTSVNTEGWSQRGVGGALSAAITTRLGMGDDVPSAITNAHEYIHSQVVYARKVEGPRPVDIHNEFVSLVAQNYRSAHDVAFYADRLAISTRYLTRVTNQVADRTPKSVIDNYLMLRARILLSTTRMSLQEVADYLGFRTQALFTKFFQKHQGMSPGEFRFS